MRARNIKPGFFCNDALLGCEPLARIAFVGLWCMADREGRLEDRPIHVKMHVLPYDSCDVNAILDQLAANKLITRYEVDGKRYIQIDKFARHQRPHPKEAASEHPGPGTSKVTKLPRDKKWVYFIQSGEGGPIKIGFGHNPAHRLSSLQGANAKRLKLLGIIAGSPRKEKEIHKLFSHLRENGEWFRCENDLLSFIATETIHPEQFTGTHPGAAEPYPETASTNLGDVECALNADILNPSSLIASSLNPSSAPSSDSQSAEPVEETPPRKPNEPDTGWLSRLWLNQLRRSPNKTDDRAADTFAEMIRHGIDAKRIEDSILDRTRRRTEALWDFEKRLLPTTGPPKRGKPRADFNNL